MLTHAFAFTRARYAQPSASLKDGDCLSYVRFVHRLTCIIVALGLIARMVAFGLGCPIWGDEAMLALNLFHRDAAGLLEPLDYAQVAPVLFLWGEQAALRMFGSSEWAARLIPFLAGSCGLLLVWDFAKRTVPPTAAAFGTCVLAVSTWPISMAATLKPYATDLFWSALLMALAARWMRRPESRWPLILLTLFVPCALFGSYPSVFVAGAVAVYLVAPAWRTTDRGTKWLCVAYAASLSASFAAVYWNMARHADDPRAVATAAFMKEYWVDGFPPSDPIRFLVWVIETHAGRMLAYPVGDSRGGSAISLLLALIGIRALWRRGDRELLLLLLTPFALNFVAAAMGAFPYGGCCRLTQHLAPATCVLIGSGIANLLDRVAPAIPARRRYIRLAAIGLAAIAGIRIAIDLREADRSGIPYWSRNVTEELRRHRHPDEPVLLRHHGGACDATLLWNLNRLGATKMDAPIPDDGSSRVWIVSIGSGLVPDSRDEKSAEPGWVTLEHVEYRLPYGPESPFHHRCIIQCLGRAGRTHVRPVLRSSP